MIYFLPIPTAVVVVWFLPACVCLSVCLFFGTISRNPTQLGSPNLTHKCSTMSQKVKSQDYESQKQCRRGSLHSCECWLLLVLLQTVTNVVVGPTTENVRDYSFSKKTQWLKYKPKRTKMLFPTLEFVPLAPGPLNK